MARALVFTVNDDAILQTMFPEAFARLPLRMSYAGPQGSGIVTNPNYYGKP